MRPFLLFHLEKNFFPFRKFSSKNAELEHRLSESIRLERFALAKANDEVRRETIGTQLREIEEKIRQITNSIRQRKRPSEAIVSLTAPLSSAGETEPWRKNRRASTLRVYDELSRLINEHVQIERQLNEMKPQSDQSNLNEIVF